MDAVFFVRDGSKMTREWYVRLENLEDDSRKGYQRIVTVWEGDLGIDDMDQEGEGEALCAAILAHHGLGREMRDKMRVFSSPFRMRRLDRLVAIPVEEVFVSVYFL
jgi:hypothetical protein